ncbi:MAG: Bro-N domain-containing protein [Anaerolineae bacterium]|nr:Bro-N domain-containing protein [Anaerolineae bacterium]
MTTLAEDAYRTADDLPDDGLVELLAFAIGLLADRGLATASDLRLLHTLEDHSEHMHEMVGSQRTDMDTTIQMFKFENKQEIRVVEGGDGEPWFIGKDVCEALGLNNVGQALSRLDDDEKNSIILNDGTPGTPVRAIISESGMYSLISRSDKPEAKRFKRWVNHDVLPSLRKHGSYVVPGRPGDSLAHQALAMAQALVDHEERLRRLEEAGRAHLLPVRAGVDSTEYYSIAAYAHIRGIRISGDTANKYGRLAAQWSKEHGYSIGQAPDPRWGRVNTYHVEALEWVFDVAG